MQILFVISILCFFALLWAGFAIARHIRMDDKRAGVGASSERDFASHLYAAATETRLPRSVRQQSVQDVAAMKSWNAAPPASVQIPPAFDDESTEMMGARRKSLQAAQTHSPERLDWVYFNKDAGDLSGLYQLKRAQRSSSAQAISTRRY